MILKLNKTYLWRAVTLSLGCVALSLVALLAFAEPGLQRRAAPAPKATKSEVEVPTPFHPGEQLNFRVLWTKFAVNAALAKFSVVEHRDFFGHSAWHFRLSAQTIQTTRLLYALDDQFDSYTDAAHLDSLQYEMYLKEQGKQQTNIWRMLTPGQPTPSDVAVQRVMPGTRDPIDFLYILRATDWKKTPELRAPIFDGVHMYDVVARMAESAGHIAVPAGNFTASRIDIRLSEHGQGLSDLHFSLWLAQDALHTPVLAEAEAPPPFGSARIELTSAQ